MEVILKELQCSICLELFKYPVILPCSHILCRSPCAERLFGNGCYVKCPVCRDSSFVSGGVANLPRVISLENIIEKYRMPIASPSIALVSTDDSDICGEHDVPCQLCDNDSPKKAVKSCLDCNASYCTKCLALSHPDWEPFNKHQLIIPTRIDRPKNAESICPHHHVKVNIFCYNCQALGCLLCADTSNTHSGHKISNLEEASSIFRNKLHGNIKMLEEAQDFLSKVIMEGEEKMQFFQRLCEDRHAKINEQCDCLISEINSKRDFFISDLEFEQVSKTEIMEDYIHDMHSKQTNLQSLLMYNRDILNENSPEVFLKLAKSVHERTNLAVEGCQSICPSSPSGLHHKVVDLRKERAFLKDMAYLQVPGTPAIDVDKCSRSVHSVVLVLSTPEKQCDVIDEYRVFYSTNSDSSSDVMRIMVFKTPGEQRTYGRGPATMNTVCLIHNDLESDTMYSFSVKAYNQSGESDISPNIQCTTLQDNNTKLKVPEIVESLCRTYTYAIQIHSPSPCVENSSTSDQQTSYYLLYREAAANQIWRNISLCGRLDHRVFGLDPDTMYDFVIMVTGSSGECQVSNMVTLRTERSAY